MGPWWLGNLSRTALKEALGWLERALVVKETNKKKKPDPELGLLGRGWGGAGPLETLFSFTSAAAHRHL